MGITSKTFMTTTTVFFLKSMIRLNVSRDTSCPTLYLAHMSQYGDVLRDTISHPEVNVFFISCPLWQYSPTSANINTLLRRKRPIILVMRKIFEKYLFSHERELWVDVEKFQSHEWWYNHQFYYDDRGQMILLHKPSNV